MPKVKKQKPQTEKHDIPKKDADLDNTLKAWLKDQGHALNEQGEVDLKNRDGSFPTKAALDWFQRENNLDRTGTPDAATRQKLAEFKEAHPTEPAPESRGFLSKLFKGDDRKATPQEPKQEARGSHPHVVTDKAGKKWDAETGELLEGAPTQPVSTQPTRVHAEPAQPQVNPLQGIGEGVTSFAQKLGKAFNGLSKDIGEHHKNNPNHTPSEPQSLMRIKPASVRPNHAAP